MVSRKKIKSSEPENNTEQNERSLTSDLPSRNKRGGKRRRSESKNLLPALIIIFAGVATFVFTNIYQQRSDTRASQDRYSQTINHTPVVEEPSSEPSVVLVEKDFATVLSNQVGYLNVRKEPSTASERLGQLEIGDKAEVLEIEDTWVKIKLDPPLGGETEGWVSSDYVEIITEEVEE